MGARAVRKRPERGGTAAIDVRILLCQPCDVVVALPIAQGICCFKGRSAIARAAVSYELISIAWRNAHATFSRTLALRFSALLATAGVGVWGRRPTGGTTDGGPTDGGSRPASEAALFFSDCEPFLLRSAPNIVALSRHLYCKLKRRAVVSQGQKCNFLCLQNLTIPTAGSKVCFFRLLAPSARGSKRSSTDPAPGTSYKANRQVTQEKVNKEWKVPQTFETDDSTRQKVKTQK